jgi:NAD-dependent SIR2 family protein deacetylase
MFFKRFWQIFSFKNCFTPHFFARKPERAVAFHSWQLRFRAGRMQKTGPL